MSTAKRGQKGRCHCAGRFLWENGKTRVYSVFAVGRRTNVSTVFFAWHTVYSTSTPYGTLERETPAEGRN